METTEIGYPTNFSLLQPGAVKCKACQLPIKKNAFICEGKRAKKSFFMHVADTDNCYTRLRVYMSRSMQIRYRMSSINVCFCRHTTATALSSNIIVNYTWPTFAYTNAVLYPRIGRDISTGEQAVSEETPTHFILFHPSPPIDFFLVILTIVRIFTIGSTELPTTTPVIHYGTS